MELGKLLGTELEPELLVAGVILLALAVAHSILGERDIIGPLMKEEWEVRDSRFVAERVLRFAWHLPSVAWAVMGLAVFSGRAVLTTAVVAAISGVIIFVALRPHPAWPLFFIAAGALLLADGRLPSPVLRVVVVGTALILAGAALLHLWWVMGGTWLLDRALPRSGNDATGLAPGRFLTVVVAALLAAHAALVFAVGFGLAAGIATWLVAGGVVVLSARAIGDAKVAGFTKSVRNTAFALADDQVFTPLVVLLALGSGAALLV